MRSKNGVNDRAIPTSSSGMNTPNRIARSKDLSASARILGYRITAEAAHRTTPATSPNRKFDTAWRK
jgi:hypothetical protein